VLPPQEEAFAKAAQTPMPKSLPLPNRTDFLNETASGLLTALNKADLDSYKRARIHDQREFPEVLVSKDLAERVAKAFHVILAGVEPLGVTWRKAQGYNSGHFRKGNDRLQLTITEDVILSDGSRCSPASYEWRENSGKLCGLLTLTLTESGSYYSTKTVQTWSESKKLPLEEVLPQLIGTIRKHFLDAQERRAKEKIEYEKQRIESERRWKEHQKAEAIRLQKEKEEKHAAAVFAAKKARKAKLLKAAERWRLSGSLLQFVEECEKKKKNQPQPLTPEQTSWLSWAKETAGTVCPPATEYPNPTKDGGFEPSSIPFGGPYPSTEDLE